MSKLIILYSDRLEAYCGNFNYTKKFSVPIFSFVCLLLVKESFYTAIPKIKTRVYEKRDREEKGCGAHEKKNLRFNTFFAFFALAVRENERSLSVSLSELH